MRQRPPRPHPPRRAPRTTRRRELMLAGLFSTLLAHSASSHAAGSEHCVLPAQLVHVSGHLQRTRAHLQLHQPLDIIAIGSSSTEGYGASSPDHSYPAQLERLLRSRHPDTAIRVFNRGRGGEIAAQTLARFGRDLLPYRPTLVIWQVGANDVVRNVPLAQFAATLEHGLDQLAAAGLEVMLMPPQYAPQTAAARQIDAYIDYLEDLAHRRGLPLIERYRLMRDIARRDASLLRAMLTPDGMHQNDLGYYCLAAQVAYAIDDQLPPSGAALIVQSKERGQ